MLLTNEAMRLGRAFFSLESLMVFLVFSSFLSKPKLASLSGLTQKDFFRTLFYDLYAMNEMYIIQNF